MDVRPQIGTDQCKPRQRSDESADAGTASRESHGRSENHPEVLFARVEEGTVKRSEVADVLGDQRPLLPHRPAQQLALDPFRWIQEETKSATA